MLTRKVAEELDEQNYFPCYFSFKGGDNHQDRAAAAMCAMLHQLFAKPLRNILNMIASQSSIGTVICVLDAIDE